MKYSPSALAFLLFLAMLLNGLVGSPSAAQVAGVKFKGKVDELWNSRPYFVNPGEPASIYTVPADRRLIVTDVLVTNENPSSALARLTSGTGTFEEVHLVVPGGSVFAHSFATGIVFDPGSEVTALATATGQLAFHLTGYLIKAK